jgi:hypothetical protein
LMMRRRRTWTFLLESVLLKSEEEAITSFMIHHLESLWWNDSDRSLLVSACVVDWSHSIVSWLSHPCDWKARQISVVWELNWLIRWLCEWQLINSYFLLSKKNKSRNSYKYALEIKGRNRFRCQWLYLAKCGIFVTQIEIQGYSRMSRDQRRVSLLCAWFLITFLKERFVSNTILLFLSPVSLDNTLNVNQLRLEIEGINDGLGEFCQQNMSHSLSSK